MTYTTIETELTQGVALVWLNRPALRNAMNDVLIDETADAVQRAIDDEAVRAIVLPGEAAPSAPGPTWPGWRAGAR